MTDKRTALEEASRFGLISARKDVLPEMGLILTQGWRGAAIKATVAQLYANSHHFAPSLKAYPELNRVWGDAWRKIALNPGAWPLSEIPEKLVNEFGPRQRQVLSAHSSGNDSGPALTLTGPFVP
jgi:hypothetical protein